MIGKIRFLFFWILWMTGMAVQAQYDFNCFTVVAGKKATADGSVILAHNEDDYAPKTELWYNVYQVPAQKAQGNATDKKKKQTAQVDDGNVAYLWLEMPGMKFSDSYMNEYGVVIVSDACPSREDKPQLSGGGISWELRNTMARKATSARHAVEIARQLILEKGYNSSGRTYCIADPNEAWMLSVVNGKHFVALRIPDDAVAVIPNYYTITTFDTADHENVIVSPGLIEYAIKRGWYNPATDGPFNFRKAYGSKESLEHMDNIGRMWAGVNLLSEQKFELKDEFPWVIRPGESITPELMMEVLKNHYEGTELEPKIGGEITNPHDAEPGSICAKYTRYGMVAHLQSGLPRELGNVLWLSPMRPCSHAFVPLMTGMKEMPEGIAYRDHGYALAHHMHPEENLSEKLLKLDYWKFEDDALLIDKKYKELGLEALKESTEATRQHMERFYDLQRKALDDFKENPTVAKELLWLYCLQAWQELTSSLEKRSALKDAPAEVAPVELTPADPRQIRINQK